MDNVLLLWFQFLNKTSCALAARKNTTVWTIHLWLSCIKVFSYAFLLNVFSSWEVFPDGAQFRLHLDAASFFFWKLKQQIKLKRAYNLNNILKLDNTNQAGFCEQKWILTPSQYGGTTVKDKFVRPSFNFLSCWILTITTARHSKNVINQDYRGQVLLK